MTTPIYQTKEEILEKVIAQFSRPDVTRLGRENADEGDEGKCIYSHSVNGIGCGVGCLLSAEDADFLTRQGNLSIHSYFSDPENFFIDMRERLLDGKPIVLKYFSPEWANFLQNIQSCHDTDWDRNLPGIDPKDCFLACMRYCQEHGDFLRDDNFLDFSGMVRHYYLKSA